MWFIRSMVVSEKENYFKEVRPLKYWQNLLKSTVKWKMQYEIERKCWSMNWDRNNKWKMINLLILSQCKALKSNILMTGNKLGMAVSFKIYTWYRCYIPAVLYYCFTIKCSFYLHGRPWKTLEMSLIWLDKQYQYRLLFLLQRPERRPMTVWDRICRTRKG